MPKRKEPELTPEEQFKRFKETAKKLGVDESGEEMERAFRRLAAEKRVKKSQTPTRES